MYLENFQVKANWRIPAIFIALLIPVAYFNSLLFHTLVEGFAIIVGIFTFMSALNTYKYSQTHFLMFVGCGYFWVAVIDFLHTITFSTMSAFPHAHEGTTIQFWIWARMFEAATLLTFTYYLHRKVNILLTFFSMAGVFLAITFAILTDKMPVLFSNETGLTNIKIFAEYFIIFLLVIASYRVKLHRTEFNQSVYRLIQLSIMLTICAELCFTLYSNLSSLLIMAGHFFKLVSFWAIYVALVDSTIKQPFKSLTLSSDTFNALPDAIVAVNQYGKILHANESALTFNNQPGDYSLIGQHVHDIFHSKLIEKEECPICNSILTGTPNPYQEIQVDDKWFTITLSPISYQSKSNVVLHVTRDISLHKETTTQYQTANRLYTVLRLTNQAIISHKTKEALLDAICNIAVNHGGFSMAWIGIIEGYNVVPVSSAGDHHGYLDNIIVRIDNSDYAKGPVGIAGKSGQVAFVNNVETNEHFAPWRPAAIRCGYKSLAVIPIMQDQTCVGVFGIYSDQEDAFDTQILELLSSLGDDINSVLAHIQTEEKRLVAEAKLKQLYLAIEQSKSAIAITDTKGMVEYINPYYEKLTGYSEQEVLNNLITDFSQCQEQDQHLYEQCWEHVMAGKDWHSEIQCINKNGTRYWAMKSVSPVYDDQGKITRIVWASKDNTELHEANETISRLAYFDALTHLPNRRLFHDRFQLAISAAKRHKTKLALMYFDLDNFKMINDSWGHDFGDLFLKHVADTLSENIRDMDTVARLGGDEFCIIVNDVVDDVDIMHVADNILHNLNKKTVLDGREIAVTTSIGISLYPDDADHVGELMKRADMAMYHAKQRGKNNFQFYEEFLNANAEHRLQMELKIKEAIHNNEFQLFYQPQFDVRTGVITGVEALLRWFDEDGNVILPSEFIPIAEETSLIIDLGKWVIHQACHEFKALMEKGFPAIKVAVNISANQFHQSKVLVESIENALESSQLPSHLLQLELTESVLIDDVDETIAIIEELKSQNITFAIDDFGTGYSSLSYLKRFPVDTIKIDRCFVRDIDIDPNSRAIIRAISVMAHELELHVLAEGVEDENQMAFLTEHRCDFVQGFHTAKPMPAQELLDQYIKGFNSHLLP